MYLDTLYGIGNRFDVTVPPLMIVHGTDDETVPYEKATELVDLYDSVGVTSELYSLEGTGHGPWSAKVNNKSLFDLAYDFMVSQQNLTEK